MGYLFKEKHAPGSPQCRVGACERGPKCPAIPAPMHCTRADQAEKSNPWVTFFHSRGLSRASPREGGRSRRASSLPENNYAMSAAGPEKPHKIPMTIGAVGTVCVLDDNAIPKARSGGIFRRKAVHGIRAALEDVHGIGVIPASQHLYQFRVTLTEVVGWAAYSSMTSFRSRDKRLQPANGGVTLKASAQTVVNRSKFATNKSNTKPAASGIDPPRGRVD